MGAMPAGNLRPVGKDGKDPFKFDGSSYDPDEFYVDSTDKRGHRERTQVSIPQGTMGAIGYVVSEIADYRSTHDFIRDAIHHRLQYCFEKLNEPGEIEGLLATERARSRAARMMREVNERIETVNDITEMLRMASQANDSGMLARMIEVAEQTVEELDEPYATQLREEIGRYQKN